MDAVTQKHSNFVKLVRKTLEDLGKKPSDECEEFLKRSSLDFLSAVSMLNKAGLGLPAVEDIILGKLGVKKTEIPEDIMNLLRRYGEYFLSVAKTLN